MNQPQFLFQEFTQNWTAEIHHAQWWCQSVQDTPPVHFHISTRTSTSRREQKQAFQLMLDFSKGPLLRDLKRRYKCWRFWTKGTSVATFHANTSSAKHFDVICASFEQSFKNWLFKRNTSICLWIVLPATEQHLHFIRSINTNIMVLKLAPINLLHIVSVTLLIRSQSISDLLVTKQK